MKQNLILIFTLSALIIGCNSKRNDLEESNLKGKIWKIQESSFKGEEKFGKYQIGDKNYWGHSLYIFNEDGNIIESLNLDRMGNTVSQSKYIYDGNNNCVEIETYEVDKLASKQINTIENNKESEVKIFDKDGNLTNFYKYNYSGDVISGGSILNKNAEPTGTFNNEISKGLLIKQTVKDSIGEVTYITSFKRNPNGDVIEQVTIHPKDTSEQKYIFQYEYDDKKNWTKQYQFDKEGKIEDIIVRNIVYYDDSKKTKSEKDFIGMWFVVDDNDWIEFRSDKKYDAGYNDRINESGTWEIDSQQQVLTFRANDPNDSKKYKYAFEGYQMVLFTIQGVEKLKLEKR